MEQFFRKIMPVVNNEIHLKIPENFATDEVEVIVIPRSKLDENQTIDFTKYFGVTNIGEEKIEQKLNELRDEWERKILN